DEDSAEEGSHPIPSNRKTTQCDNLGIHDAVLATQQSKGTTNNNPSLASSHARFSLCTSCTPFHSIPSAMATAMHCSCALTASTLALAPSGASTSKTFQKTSVRISQARTWPSHVSGRRPVVSADYGDRRGGGAGDFVAGFLLGGAVFGALGYILAPQISKSLEEGDSVKDEGTAAKRPARYLEDDEGLEKTRQTLNEKIAQLNAAIDDVSAQLRTEEGLGNQNGNNVELESAA
ncbi:hypothetical protein KC19_11G133900, partial [Ceratodon purpureus]